MQHRPHHREDAPVPAPEAGQRVPLWLTVVVALIAGVIVAGATLFILTLQHVARVAPAIQSPVDVVLTLGADLAHDARGRTNVLLLGSGGRYWDEGTDLTDSIMVASIDEAAKSVLLVSIPRDLYVDIPVYGWSRLNYVWPYSVKHTESDGPVPALPKEMLRRITGLEIHYVLRVDFRGFTRLIDALGGVDVTVENAFTDTMYPTEDYRYQTVRFDAGPTTLDGDQALKFVRSRHASGVEGTDYARSRRQQLVLQAVRAQLMDQALLDDEQRLTELVNLVNEHYVTDVTVAQMLTFARLAKTIPKDRIFSFTLSAETGDGLLYEPDDEERTTRFGGAFVILPVDPSYDAVHREIATLLDHPELLRDPLTAVVLNGSTQAGLAAGVANLLKLQRVEVVLVGNAAQRDVTRTLVVDRTGSNAEEAARIATTLGGVVGPAPADQPLPEESDLLIIVAPSSAGASSAPAASAP